MLFLGRFNEERLRPDKAQIEAKPLVILVTDEIEHISQSVSRDHNIDVIERESRGDHGVSSAEEGLEGVLPCMPNDPIAILFALVCPFCRSFLTFRPHVWPFYPLQVPARIVVAGYECWLGVCTRVPYRWMALFVLS